MRSLGELTDIYIKSVGGNATFLLNIPPTREGLLHENDVRRLKEIGEFLRTAFADNIAPQAEITADSEAPGCGAEYVKADSYDSFFMPEGSTAEITLRFDSPEKLGYLVIKENIRMSQRVESFGVDICENGGFRSIYSGTVIGYKRIVPLGNVRADGIRIRITDSRVVPTISFIGVYRSGN